MNQRVLLKALKLTWQLGKNWLLINLIGNVFLGLTPLILLWISKELINQIELFLRNKYIDLYAFGLLLFIQFSIGLLVSILSNVQDLEKRKLETKMNFELQKQVIQKTTKCPISNFDDPQFLNHLSRINNGMGSRFLAPIESVFEFIKLSISIISLALFLANIHWVLVILCLLSSIPNMIVRSRFAKKSFWISFHQTPISRETSYTSALLTERKSAKEIRLYNLSEYLIGRWKEGYHKSSNELLAFAKAQKNANIGLDIVSGLIYIISAMVILWVMNIKALQIGDYVAIGQAVMSAQTSINQVTSVLTKVYTDSLYLSDFYSFIENEKNYIKITRGKNSFPLLTRGITAENVSFKYLEDNQLVLRNISFEIKKGEKVAIVGENGSGKSTLIKCLIGLYPLSGGFIKFDDLNINDIVPEELNHNISVLFQDFMKYEFTIKDNIVFGDIKSSEDQNKLKDAIVKSGIDSLIVNLPNGYDTSVGKYYSEGIDLSGGQWQKIAFARSIFKDSQIIILDEPTASLDPSSEVELFDLVERIVSKKTTIFISHNMQSARRADKILVMKEGQIVETGSHEELMARKNEYYRMYSMQNHSALIKGSELSGANLSC